MKPEPIRIYLVDDQAMIRAALRRFFARRSAFEVVGSSGEPQRALEEIRVVRPDVVVLDIAMPGLSGLDLLPLIRGSLPATKVVMLTHHRGPAFIEQAYRAGAAGFLSKDCAPDELALTIAALHVGEG